MAGAAVAGAQTNGPSGFSVRLGAFFPTSSVARALNNTWFTGGLDYKITRYSVDAPTEDTLSYLSLSADYYESKGVRNIPVALHYNIRNGQFVYSAGVGADFRRIGGDGVGLHGQLSAAYEFANANSPNTPFFVQAKYFFASKSVLNGLGVYFGWRF